MRADFPWSRVLCVAGPWVPSVPPSKLLPSGSLLQPVHTPTSRAGNWEHAVEYFCKFAWVFPRAQKKKSVNGEYQLVRRACGFLLFCSGIRRVGGWVALLAIWLGRAGLPHIKKRKRKRCDISFFPHAGFLSLTFFACLFLSDMTALHPVPFGGDTVFYLSSQLFPDHIPESCLLS